MSNVDINLELYQYLYEENEKKTQEIDALLATLSRLKELHNANRSIESLESEGKLRIQQEKNIHLLQQKYSLESIAEELIRRAEEIEDMRKIVMFSQASSRSLIVTSISVNKKRPFIILVLSKE